MWLLYEHQAVAIVPVCAENNNKKIGSWNTLVTIFCCSVNKGILNYWKTRKWAINEPPIKEKVGIKISLKSTCKDPYFQFAKFATVPTKESITILHDIIYRKMYEQDTSYIFL